MIGRLRPDDALDDTQLNRRWRPALMAFFLRRIHNRAEAEDLTQEVFARMLRSDETGVQADAYIFEIAANLLTDRARKAKVREKYRESVGRDPDRDVDWLDPFHVAVGRERMATFAAALDQLPERTRTIFILYRIENLSQEAIGATYGISASAVKQQVAKAMAFLAKRMRDLP